MLAFFETIILFGQVKGGSLLHGLSLNNLINHRYLGQQLSEDDEVMQEVVGISSFE